MVLIAFLISSCDDEKEDENGSIEWKEIANWQEKTIASTPGDYVRIRHNASETDPKWVVVNIYDTETDEDSLIIGPFPGHAPSDDGIEFFKNDPNTDQDDEWVIEYACPEGCCVQVYGKENGKLKLKKSYSIRGHNCQFTKVDTAAGQKNLFFSTYGSDTVSVLRINYHTGDSIYFASDTGDILRTRDLELVDGKIITVHHINDTNYVVIKFPPGTLPTILTYFGKFIDAKDDGNKTKIIITRKDSTLTSRVLNFNRPQIGSVSGIDQEGRLVDLQMHRINGKTYYVVTSHDAQRDITHISIIGEDGQGIANHVLQGKLFKAKKRPNDNKKVFVTSQPVNNDGSGVTNIGIYDIERGIAFNPQPRRVSGRPTKLQINQNGVIQLETRDTSGSATNTTVQVN